MSWKLVEVEEREFFVKKKKKKSSLDLMKSSLSSFLQPRHPRARGSRPTNQLRSGPFRDPRERTVGSWARQRVCPSRTEEERKKRDDAFGI
jgi:hypothetical protein